MQVALLQIENFRGIRHGELQFRDHTVLIGPNNSGKTTIVEALVLVLGRDRLVRSLTEHDFYGSDPKPSDRIKIIATITGFEPEDFSIHTDWFREGRGVPCWFDTADGSVLPEKANDRQRLVCQIVFAAYFNRESLEVETARYFSDDDDIDIFAEESFVNVPDKLIREIGFFLVPASRSWDRMLSFSSELFKRVIRSAGGLPAETILEERDRLRRPKHKLEDDDRLRPVVENVNDEIAKLLGRPIPLRLRLTTTDSAGFLETVVPHFETGDRMPLPTKREGSGLVSLQSLFLLLHFGQKRIEDGDSFLMVLEEPELHLPPAVQRRVLLRLQALSTQTIVSTHSFLSRSATIYNLGFPERIPRPRSRCPASDRSSRNHFVDAVRKVTEDLQHKYDAPHMKFRSTSVRAASSQICFRKFSIALIWSATRLVASERSCHTSQLSYQLASSGSLGSNRSNFSAAACLPALTS